MLTYSENNDSAVVKTIHLLGREDERMSAYFNSIGYSVMLCDSYSLNTAELDILLVDADSDNFEINLQLLQELDFSTTRVVAFSDNPKGQFLYDRLKQAGIGRLVLRNDLLTRPELVVLGRIESHIGNGAVLLYEKDKATARIIESFCADYDIRFKWAQDLQTFFDYLGEGNAIILTHIGCDDVDIPSLSHRILYSCSLNSSIFVPYADASKISCTDLKGPLRNLAKAVLTIEEVYNFMINLFGRILLHHTGKRMFELSSIEGGEEHSSKTLVELYHLYGSDFFTPPEPLSADKITELMDALERVKTAIARSLPFSWLVSGKESGFQCGEKGPTF